MAAELEAPASDGVTAAHDAVGGGGGGSEKWSVFLASDSDAVVRSARAYFGGRLLTTPSAAKHTAMAVGHAEKLKIALEWYLLRYGNTLTGGSSGGSRWDIAAAVLCCRLLSELQRSVAALQWKRRGRAVCRVFSTIGFGGCVM